MAAKMKGILIVVDDVSVSKAFYESLLDQKLLFDLGACQQFESGLTLQSKASMQELFHIQPEKIQKKSNNCVLYFETGNFDETVIAIRRKRELELVHDVIEYDWGQRGISFYDPDGHVVDVSESMESVFQRYDKQGMSAEAIAKKTEHPLEFVKSCLG